MDWDQKRPWYLSKGKDFKQQAHWSRSLKEARQLTATKAEEIMRFNKILPQTQRASVLKFTEKELFLIILKDNG